MDETTPQSIVTEVDEGQAEKEDLSVVSQKVKDLFSAQGLEVYLPDFAQEAQAGGSRIYGFGVKDPNDFTLDYEIDILEPARGSKEEKPRVFFKSIWPERNMAFESKYEGLIQSAGYDTLFASYTH